MKRSVGKLIFAAILLFAANACKDDEPPLPDNLIAFEAAEAGFEDDKSEMDLNIVLSRAVSTPLEVVLTVTPTKLTYGQEYTTNPASSNGEITVTIPANQTTGKVTVMKNAGAVINGDETIDFKLKSVTDPILVGTQSVLKLSFSAIVSESGSLIINGREGTEAYHNSVYVDLSGNAMTTVPRKSWNLGFYSGSAFRVILNPGYLSMATALEKTELSSVTLADTGSIEHVFAIGEGDMTMVDDWTGDITKTAIAEISATEANNKVYLISFEDSKEKNKWFKVKISRNGNGYRVRYARIGDTSIKTLDVPKSADYNFVFASLETDKVVPVEPRSASWDFQWGYSVYNSGANTPYWFQDFILLNHLAGAEAAEVLNSSTLTYANFGESNLSEITFSNKQDAIGSKWRSGGGPTSGPAIRSDRFYVIKDPAGNYYKLRFTSLAVNDQRGRPQFEYALLKAAE